jgi:DNA-binding NarL/FixJ family response regulator
MGAYRARGGHVSKHILIVDDSALIRRIIRETLEQQNGWEVSGEAANGREAIEKAQELRPDLIVLDLAMPVMNGLEAARALKRLLPRVPVLMFTNFDAAHLKREALAAGVRAVVSKSGSLQSLVSAIQGLLEPAA